MVRPLKALMVSSTKPLSLSVSEWIITCTSYFSATDRQRSEERRVGKECRSRCDWSSDVCSSDLAALEGLDGVLDETAFIERVGMDHHLHVVFFRDRQAEIGRASCRERV